MKNFWRRKKILTDRLQLRLLGINLLYLSMLLLVFGFALFGPFVLTLHDPDASHEDKQEAADALLLLHQTIWPPILVVALAFFYHSVVYTHRIAGPLYRFRKVFEDVDRGNLTARANIRTHDYLQREARVINQMVERLSDRVNDLAAGLGGARAAAAALGVAHARGSEREAAVALGSLEAHLDLWESRLAALRGASGERELAGSGNVAGGPDDPVSGHAPSRETDDGVRSRH